MGVLPGGDGYERPEMERATNESIENITERMSDRPSTRDADVEWNSSAVDDTETERPESEAIDDV